MEDSPDQSATLQEQQPLVFMGNKDNPAVPPAASSALILGGGHMAVLEVQRLFRPTHS